MADSENSTRLLRSRHYGSFWFSSLLSNIGTWMQSVAEPWLVLNISGSPFLIGLDSFAMNAPFWILTLVGGVLADRKDRGLIIYFFQGTQMLCPLLIVILVATGWVKVWMIIGLSLVVGITDALSMPAFSSLIPSLVSKRDLKPALALNAIQFNLSRVVGPAIAGLVMLKYGPLWCFGANALSYVPFFLSIYWLRPLMNARQEATENDDHGPLLRSIVALVTNPTTGFALLSVFANAFFCSPIITFSPVIVKNVLHGDMEHFGGVMTAFGVGGLLGPLLILVTIDRIGSLKLSLSAAATYGLCIISASYVGTAWQLAAVLVGSGFLMTIANTSANTFLQSTADNRSRGQMASLFMLAMRGGISLGNMATGTLVSQSSIQTALLINGFLALACQTFIILRMARAAKAGWRHGRP